MVYRLGLFGGSFDPIHMGHLLLAELCAESLQLDRVKFLPAYVSPLKTHSRPIEPKHRIEMLRLAIGSNLRMELDTREVERAGVSYTIDTVRSIRAEFPEHQLFLLMGADVLKDLHRWRDPTELFRLVIPSVIARGGYGEPPWDFLRPFVPTELWESVRSSQVIVPQVEISSSDLKARIAAGKSIRYQVPASVEIYIQENRLYQDESQ
jgi:nicotinate-nucleotide adenylyltransferase